MIHRRLCALLLGWALLPGIGFADFFKRDMTATEMASKAGCFLQAE